MNARVRIGRVSRIFVVASAAVAALLLGAAASASAGTLDQQQTSSNGFATLDTNLSWAQTFTAGISGGLDQADLSLMKTGTPPTTVTVEIRSTSASTPTATVLATSTIPTSGISTDPAGTFVAVTFGTPAPVTAGTRYALVAWSPGTGTDAVEWFYQSEGNPYPNGAFFRSPDTPPGGTWSEEPTSDFAFKTYVAPSGSSATGTCKGQQATIVGTAGNDVRSGTPGRDVMVGLGGIDSLSGLGGKDLICGGSGKDKLKGGAGSDTLLGQAGKDILRGGGAKDVCKGGKGNDSGKCEVEKSL
jgi:Ca2+-binding RTX toxin-like protein